MMMTRRIDAAPTPTTTTSGSGFPKPLAFLGSLSSSNLRTLFRPAYRILHQCVFRIPAKSYARRACTRFLSRYKRPAFLP
jgi:hypothetical protein